MERRGPKKKRAEPTRSVSFRIAVSKDIKLTRTAKLLGAKRVVVLEKLLDELIPDAETTC